MIELISQSKIGRELALHRKAADGHIHRLCSRLCMAGCQIFDAPENPSHNHERRSSENGSNDQLLRTCCMLHNPILSAKKEYIARVYQALCFSASWTLPN